MDSLEYDSNRSIYSKIDHLFSQDTSDCDVIAKKILSVLYTQNEHYIIDDQLRVLFRKHNQTPKGHVIIQALFRLSALHGKSALVYTLLHDKLKLENDLKVNVLKENINQDKTQVSKEIFLTLTKQTQDRLLKELKSDMHKKLL